jgi:hypothetical protein
VLARYDADGHLDSAFGNGGSIMTSVGSYDAHPRTVVTQPDQKIVTAGYAYDGDGIARFMLVRHLGGGPCDDTPCTTTTTSTAATTSTTSTTLACAVDATKARLVAARLAPPSGDDTLKLTGVATIPTTRIVDPATDGLRLLYGGPTSVVVDVTVPPGRYDPASGRGWSARSGTFRYVDHTASGVRKVLVKAMDPASGTYKVQLAGKNADYAVAADDLPLHAIVVLDPPVAASGQCATWRFPASPPARPSCTRNAGGTAVRCR